MQVPALTCVDQFDIKIKKAQFIIHSSPNNTTPLHFALYTNTTMSRSNSKVIAKQACTVCSKKGWWNLERDSYRTKIKTCLLSAGHKNASDIVNTATRKAEIKGEDHKAWYASVPCSQCNRDGSKAPPELWYYRLIWTDKTNTCYVARTDEGNGRDLTMEEFDTLNDWANEAEDDEEEEEDEKPSTAQQKKTKAANAKKAKNAPSWVSDLFGSKTSNKKSNKSKKNNSELVIEGAPDEINALFQY